MNSYSTWPLTKEMQYEHYYPSDKQRYTDKTLTRKGVGKQIHYVWDRIDLTFLEGSWQHLVRVFP